MRKALKNKRGNFGVQHTYYCKLSRFRNVYCVNVRTLSLGLCGVTIPWHDERRLLARENKGVELTT